MSKINKYKYHVFFCTNKRIDNHPRGCCADKGSLKLRNLMKASVKSLKINNVRINVAGCLDNCENGPTVVIYPEGAWYKVRKKLDVEEIISEHLMKGNKVQRLLIEKEK